MKKIDEQFTRRIVVVAHSSPLFNFKHEFNIEEDETTLGHMQITFSPFRATVESAGIAHHVCKTAGKHIKICGDPSGSTLISTQMRGVFFWTTRFNGDVLGDEFSFRPWPSLGTKPGFKIANELCGTVSLRRCFPLTLDINAKPCVELPVVVYSAALYLLAWDNYAP